MRSVLVELLIALLPITVFTLKCTVCDFKLLPPHNSACNETCEGDVCYIVVNKYFNGTINAGCMHLRDGDSFEAEAICQRGPHDNRCACTTFDECNNPNVSITKYTFTESPLLESYQWLPQIQPPMSSLEPISPPEEIPVGGDMNETVTELETGVENDLNNELDDKEKTNSTQILRSEENDPGVLTVTTTLGLNVRDHTNRMNASTNNHPSKTDVDGKSTTTKTFNPGQGSVEVTKVTQEAPPPKFSVPNGNLTADGSSVEDPNSTRSFKILMITVLPFIVRSLL